MIQNMVYAQDWLTVFFNIMNSINIFLNNIVHGKVVGIWWVHLAPPPRLIRWCKLQSNKSPARHGSTCYAKKDTGLVQRHPTLVLVLLSCYLGIIIYSFIFLFVGHIFSSYDCIIFIYSRLGCLHSSWRRGKTWTALVWWNYAGWVFLWRCHYIRLHQFVSCI